MSVLGQVSVVVPVHNEEKRLPLLLGSVDFSLFGEAIFVLDGCTDNSGVIIPKSSKKIVLKKRRGKGFAMREGFLVSKKKFVCFIDADGTFSQKQVDGICTLAKRKGGLVLAERRTFPKKRAFKRNVLRVISKALFGITERDTQCGLLVIEREKFAGIFGKLSSAGYELPIELIFKAKNAGINVSTHPVDIPEENYDNSTFNETLDPLKMLFSLIGLRLRG